jgi:hypothetical protein
MSQPISYKMTVKEARSHFDQEDPKELQQFVVMVGGLLYLSAPEKITPADRLEEVAAVSALIANETVRVVLDDDDLSMYFGVHA